MTRYTQADVEMADRHIAEGECHIARQEELVSRLGIQGHSTREAEKLLALLNSTQVEHHVHRAAIVAALQPDGRS